MLAAIIIIIFVLVILAGWYQFYRSANKHKLPKKKPPSGNNAQWDKDDEDW